MYKISRGNIAGKNKDETKSNSEYQQINLQGMKSSIL